MRTGTTAGVPVFFFALYHKAGSIATKINTYLYIFGKLVTGGYTLTKRRCDTMPRTSKNINIEIGHRIKQERLNQKLTREQLAHLVGYSANFIQEVERGRSGLSSESMRAFSVALKVSSDYLLFGVPSKSYDYLCSKLSLIPQEKHKYIIQILDAAVECAGAWDENV